MEGMGVVGIDVSNARLDVAFRPSGKRLTVANGARGISRLVTVLKAAAPDCVVLEATCGYEFKLVERLLAEGLPVVVVNTRQVRQFARATGRLAKTDAIDAEILAHYAEAMKPEQRVMPDAQTRKCGLIADGCWESSGISCLSSALSRTRGIRSVAPAGLCLLLRETKIHVRAAQKCSCRSRPRGAPLLHAVPLPF